MSMSVLGVQYIISGFKRSNSRIEHEGLLYSNESITSLPDFDSESVPDHIKATRSSVPHAGFSKQNKIWTIVQTAMVSLLYKNPLPVYNYTEYLSMTRSLLKEDIGPFIFDFFQNQVLKNGFSLLTRKFKKAINAGECYEKELIEKWNHFYKESLPALQFFLFPMEYGEDLTVRQATLVGFRDYFALQIDLKDYIEKLDGEPPDAIKQMLLILQSACEKYPPSVNYLKIESLVALVIKPYVGFGGVYDGSSTPVHKAIQIHKMRGYNYGDSCKLNSKRGESDSVLPAITLKEYNRSQTQTAQTEGKRYEGKGGKSDKRTVSFLTPEFPNRVCRSLSFNDYRDKKKQNSRQIYKSPDHFNEVTNIISHIKQTENEFLSNKESTPICRSIEEGTSSPIPSISESLIDHAEESNLSSGEVNVFFLDIDKTAQPNFNESKLQEDDDASPQPNPLLYDSSDNERNSKSEC